MSTKLQTHKYKCKCKLVTYTQALESVADLKQIALLVITFPCRCRGLGRPRREKVDAQSHTNKQVDSFFCDRGSDQRAASSICLTKEIRLAAAHSPWPSNANIARSRRQRRGLRPARATGHPMDLRRCCPKPDNHQGSVSPTVQTGR